jgi:hypothetical protein
MIYDVLSPKESLILREKCVQIFVDTTSVAFTRRHILRQYRDGLHYPDYLWDYLNIDVRIISHMEAVQMIQQKKNLLLMTDDKSETLIFIPNYFKFPREAVLYIPDGKELGVQIVKDEKSDRGEALLPEDIYIFDETFTWLIFLTHEYINNDTQRICGIKIKKD